MKSVVTVFLVIFIFISGAACYASSPEVEEVPDEVLVVAQEGADKLEGIMRGEFENWHFSNENEVDKLELSEGIRIYSFDHTTFFYNRESLLNAIEYSVEHWLFTL